jgi:hypothetical protein
MLICYIYPVPKLCSDHINLLAVQNALLTSHS